MKETARNEEEGGGREGGKSHVPFWSISRCSHRISPMKAGARAKKDSFPMAQICFPVMFCQGCIATPARENSPMAQCNQWATAASDHCLGSETVIPRVNTDCIPS